VARGSGLARVISFTGAYDAITPTIDQPFAGPADLPDPGRAEERHYFPVCRSGRSSGCAAFLQEGSSLF